MIVNWVELNKDFSSSYTDGKNESEAAEIIREFLGSEPDGSMTNLNMFKILLDNVLCVYNRQQIKLEKIDFENGEYFLKMEVKK